VEVRKDQSIYFNKQEATYAQFPLTIGGFPATREVEDKCFDIGPIHKCANSMTVEVTLGPQEKIIMKVFQDMVRVEVTGRPREMFMGSMGLTGSYPATRHGRVDHDGFTCVQDANEVGQE
jgi:hypothetical protein